MAPDETTVTRSPSTSARAASSSATPAGSFTKMPREVISIHGTCSPRLPWTTFATARCPSSSSSLPSTWSTLGNYTGNYTGGNRTATTPATTPAEIERQPSPKSTSTYCDYTITCSTWQRFASSWTRSTTNCLTWQRLASCSPTPSSNNGGVTKQHNPYLYNTTTNYVCR